MVPKGLVYELFWCEMGHRINPFWSESWEMGTEFTETGMNSLQTCYHIITFVLLEMERKEIYSSIT